MISIILSTNNELRNNYLERIFQALENQDSTYEIIIVDNESTDGTIELCRKYTDKIYYLPDSNRAQRFNHGMKQTQWEVVLFHHPVTIIPHNSLWYIQKYIDDGWIWWWYRHSFDHHHWLLKFTSWYSNNVRWWWSWILYADHIIFWNKKAFSSIWWFPNRDVVEETPLCKSMIKKYDKPIIIPYTVLTSARRFIARWIYTHALLNQYIKIGYYLWLSDKIMNKQYEKKDGFNVNY